MRQERTKQPSLKLIKTLRPFLLRKKINKRVLIPISILGFYSDGYLFAHSGRSQQQVPGMGRARDAATSESGARSAAPLLSGNLVVWCPSSGLGRVLGEGGGQREKGGGCKLHSQCKEKKKKGTKSNFLFSPFFFFFSVEQKPERILGARLEISLKHLKSTKDRVSRWNGNFSLLTVKQHNDCRRCRVGRTLRWLGFLYIVMVARGGGLLLRDVVRRSALLSGTCCKGIRSCYCSWNQYKPPKFCLFVVQKTRTFNILLREMSTPPKKSCHCVGLSSKQLAHTMRPLPDRFLINRWNLMSLFCLYKGVYFFSTESCLA